MQNIKISSMVSYENWVKMINRSDAKNHDSKLKPKSPSSNSRLTAKPAGRSKRSTSEMWLG